MKTTEARAVRVEGRMRRGRRRGAMMVEALVVIPFFIVIFASTMFISSFYRSKQDALRIARMKAWTESLGGDGACVPNDKTTTEKVGELANPDGTPAEEIFVSLGLAPGAELCPTEFNEAQGTAPTKSMTSPGGMSFDIGGTAELICDEHPKTGNFDDALNQIWSIARTAK